MKISRFKYLRILIPFKIKKVEKIKQVIRLRIGLSSSWDSRIEQINAVLKEYQDRNGELVSFGKDNVSNTYFALIQYDA